MSKRPFKGRATNPDIDDKLSRQKWEFAAGVTDDKPWRMRRTL